MHTWCTEETDTKQTAPWFARVPTAPAPVGFLIPTTLALSQRDHSHLVTSAQAVAPVGGHGLYRRRRGHDVTIHEELFLAQHQAARSVRHHALLEMVVIHRHVHNPVAAAHSVSPQLRSPQ
jgi:hypothetical protein